MPAEVLIINLYPRLKGLLKKPGQRAYWVLREGLIVA